MVYDILNEQFASPTRGCMFNDERERERENGHCLITLQ